MLPMGLAVVLSNGPKPEIMLAIDFRGPFCSTFYAHYFLLHLLVRMNANAFGQAKSGKATTLNAIFS